MSLIKVQNICVAISALAWVAAFTVWIFFTGSLTHFVMVTALFVAVVACRCVGEAIQREIDSIKKDLEKKK